jgi:hypothetical protein
MSFVQRTARRSTRFIATGLLLTLVSTIALASRWDSVTTFARSVGSAFGIANAEDSGGTKRIENSNPEAFLAPGTCDTAGPIEIESSGGTLAGTPTPYATLAAAFTAINGGTLHLGVITIDVCGNTTEAATAGLNQVAGVTSVTISPAGGAARTISGAIAAGSPLINLNGADNVTIDGLNSGGNSLTISNTTIGTTTGTSTIRFIADATGNTVNRTTILGSSTSTLATVAGTVVFSTGTTTGNDNNTISNCDIGPAGANLPSKAIMASGTSSTIENDNVQITGNNIFDFFLPGSSLSGINILTGNEGWTIQNNKFYQTAARTFTTAASRYAAITLNNSTGSFTVSGNTIGFGASNGTGTTTISGSSNEIRAIDAASVSTTAPATVIQNNIISGINQTSSRASTTTASSPFIAVAMGTTDGLFNATGNTIGSLDGSSTIVLNHTSITASTAPAIGIYNFSNFSTNISNNNIGSFTIQSTGTVSGFRGILVNTATSATATINNNTIANITDTQVGSYSVYGIQTALPNATITGNTIRNFTSASNGAALIISAGILTSGATGNNTISQNTIHSLSNASGAAANSIYGMSLSLPSTTNLVERNFIHSLSLTSTVTGTQIWGISGGATGTTTYQNNMIRLGVDAAGNSVTLPSSVIGIRDAAGATNQFYHNTIYIGGSGVLAAPTPANSYCIFSDVTAVTRAFQDNIFWNARSNAVGGGTAQIAIRVGGTAANPAGLTSNFNVLFANGTDGATGVFNAVVVPTLTAWRTATGQDLNSFANDPMLIAPNGTAGAVDLHINPAIPTVIEGNGILIASVTNDFDNQTRSGLTPVDIGADAGNFTGLDLVPPTIIYTALGNTTSTSNRTVSAAISDATGVASGANLPRIYFKKSTDAGYVSTQCVLVSAPNYNCTIDYSLVGGGSVTVNDIVQYFVAAQDTLGNFTTNPSGGTGSVNSVTFAGTPNSYTILSSISGNKTVGTGGDYPTLTAAVTALNNSQLTGAVTLSLTDAAYPTETFPLTINANNGSSATNTVTIKPAAGVSPSISGSSASCVINFNGADYLTIDGSNAVGGTSRDLTITNTNAGTSSAVVCLTSLGAGSGATNDTVKNTKLTGTTVTATAGTLFGVFSGSSTISITSAGADNDNNTIQNNSITKTSYGIYTGGASAANKNAATVITQNVMNSASPANITTGGILANFEDGIQISQNDIAVLKHDGTTGTTNTAFGIALGLVPNNTVTTFTGSDVTNASVTRNRINGVTQLNSTGYSTFGIVINSVTSGTTQVSNNLISGVVSPSTASDFSAGIMAGGGTGSTTQIYFNSVAMSGARGSGTGFPSYGLAINSGNPVVDVKDNIFYNTQTGGTGKAYAIANASTTFTNMISSFNDLFVSGASTFVGQTGGLGTAGTDRLNLAAWNTATGQDAPPSSKSVDPSFINILTDLHIPTTSLVESQGTSVSGITVDFDGDTRPATPDIGADEVTPAPPGTIQFNAPTYTVGEGGSFVTLTVTRTGGTNGAVAANYALAGGTATGGAACGAGIDYVNTGGMVNFADGSATPQTFDVTVCDDDLFESSETFNATLSIASGLATLGTPNPAAVTITDNDAQPSLQFSGATYSAPESGGTLAVTVTRSGASENVVSVDYSMTDGTATGGAVCGAGVDYVISSGTLFFASGDGAKTFFIQMCGDNLFESDETVNLALGNYVGATAGAPATATATILNNDAAPTLAFSNGGYTSSDDLAANFRKGDQFAPQTATITVNRFNAVDNVVSVDYATGGGTATGGAACAPGSGVDYVTTSGTLTFAAGETAKSFDVTVCTDALFEGDETVFLTLSNPTAPAVLGAPNPAILTITDNDAQPAIAFASATYTNSDDIAHFGETTKDFAPAAATITVNRTGAVDNAVSVDYATVGGGTATGGAACTAGVDYITTSGTLSFAAGVTSQSFSVTVCTDGLFEGSESVNLALSNATAPALLGTPTTATLTILDNDPQPSLQFSTAAYSVNEAGPAATLTVTRTGAPDNAVSVNYGPTGGTATGGAVCSGGTDYVNTAGTVNFAAGETSKTFNIPICDDAVAEPAETVNLLLTGPTGGAVIGAQSTAVLTINDNDAADYAVTTTGNAIVVTDNKDNGDIVNISEPAAGQILFGSTGRTFQIDGGTIITGNSGNLPLASVTSITFNGQGGNDTVNTGAFTSALPNLTVNGGTGNDAINFNGIINFAANANLDVDLQNDDAAPGTDNINVSAPAALALSGTGTATFKASQSINFNGSAQVSVVNGNLTVEANQQATPTTGNFRGVTVGLAALTTSGSGNISIKGKGGSGAFAALRGVFISGGSVTSTSSTAGAGTITIDGTGGAGSVGNNRGVEFNNAANAVTSVRGDIAITGQGGAGSATLNVGVQIQVAGVRSTGPAKITINGTGGTGTNANTGFRLLNLGAEITSAGGDISITGNGGTSVTGNGNHGATFGFGAIVSATNGARITIVGTAGGGTLSNAGVIISLADQTVTTAFSKILSDSGDISITGNGGAGSGLGGGGNIGININSGGVVAATGPANVTINGTGGTCPDPSASDCYGVDFESAGTPGTAVTTAAGNLTVTGTAPATTGQRQNGIRFEDSAAALPITMTTGTGSLTLDASTASTDPTSAALEFSDDTALTLGGATNTFIADTIDIGSSQVSINAGVNALTLRPKTNARPIDLGGADTPTVLGLTDAELDLITAGTLNIGNSATGNIAVTSNITRASATVMNLVSGADIGANTGSVSSGGGNLTVDPAGFLFAPNSGVDFNTGASSTLTIAPVRTLRLSLGTPVVDTGYEQLNVAGKVDITGVTLSLTALSTPAGGNIYTIINNDGGDAITGTFTGLPEGTVIPNFLGSGLSASITYVGGDGNDCVITVLATPTLQFSTATGSIGEAAGTATLTVTRTGSTAGAATVDYLTASGTATGGASCGAGIDFVNASGTLSFATGDASKTFPVTICNDALIEGGEAFTATLSNPTGGAGLGTITTETVTITDDDTDTVPPVISYTPLPNIAAPPVGVLPVTATDAVGVTSVTVFWSVNGGSFNSAACSFASGTAQSGVWNCQITGVPNPSAVGYLVAAQDAAGNPVSNPSGGLQNLFSVGTGTTIPPGNYLNVNVGGGSTLGGNSSVSGVLGLNGPVTTGANTLTLGCAASVTGAGGFNYVIGNLEKQFCAPGVFNYPVGTTPDGAFQGGIQMLSPEGVINPEYTPFVANVTAGTFPSSLTVSVTDGLLAGSDPGQSATRFWNVTETGDLTADISYTYLDQDIAGTEATYKVLRRSGTTALYPGGTVNAPTNTATAPNVSNFSAWAAGNLVPTAANAEIGGRVLTASGEGIRNATVMVTGGNLTTPLYVKTTTFGSYRFTGLPVGQNYVVQVISQRYVFSRPSRVLNLTDSVSDADFVADPQ